MQWENTFNVTWTCTQLETLNVSIPPSAGSCQCRQFIEAPGGIRMHWPSGRQPKWWMSLFLEYNLPYAWGTACRDSTLRADLRGERALWAGETNAREGCRGPVLVVRMEKMNVWHEGSFEIARVLVAITAGASSEVVGHPFSEKIVVKLPEKWWMAWACMYGEATIGCIKGLVAPSLALAMVLAFSLSLFFVFQHGTKKH